MTERWRCIAPSSCKMKDLLSKTNGSLLMISAFICPCHGILGSSFELLIAGAIRDGYWDNEMLVNRIENVIPYLRSFILVTSDCFVLTVLKPIKLKQTTKAKKKYLRGPTMWGLQNTEEYMVFIDRTIQSAVPAECLGQRSRFLFF